ncbi:dihydroxyacetone kinase DhaM subunit [Granulicatella balaenopterae]|uniref:phosphoenolpyruvate--glycerone phosphotransferase n=1 Tax=Granulicatella balaenopterae TaxID=137733 RepID=A0A1H9P3F3_9LACT|nr:dihydroxyacetone kinase phosphoryl donor subunit DhaM [Granulicatella balaenopterae]SER42597.1 dihydroxyacetone kinase DhaM subunit [Granulicatella balaenopterae]
MYGIVLVSHSEKIAIGLKDMIDEMINTSEVTVLAAGGTGDGRLGTSAVVIYEELQKLKECSSILVFSDIGSSILSSEMAVELIDDEELKEKVVLVSAPLIEGAFAGAVSLSAGLCLEDALKEVNNN